MQIFFIIGGMVVAFALGASLTLLLLTDEQASKFNACQKQVKDALAVADKSTNNLIEANKMNRALAAQIEKLQGHGVTVFPEELK